MNFLRRLNFSAALIVLVCFFLPWVQVSCAGARDTLSGVDVARDGHFSLWFVPVLMGVLVLAAIIRFSRQQNSGLPLASILGGLISAYLINDERLRVNDQSGFIQARLTGWFWLGLLSALIVAAAGIAMLVKRRGAT